MVRSDMGAEPSVRELDALPDDRSRLLVAFGAAVRTSGFVSSLNRVVDVGAVDGLRLSLESCLTSSRERFEDVVATLPSPGVLRDADPEAWPRLAGPTWIGVAHLDALLGCFEFAVGRRTGMAAGVLGSIVEAMEAWAEQDMARDGEYGADLEDSVWFGRKYSFLPPAAELGAMRLDVLASGGGGPDPARKVIDRAHAHARRVTHYFRQWSVDPASRADGETW